MPKGYRLNTKGRWIHDKGSGKRGYASNAEIEDAFLRDAGYFKNKAGRYQKVAGGQFASKTEIEEAKTGGANARINQMTWNKIKYNTEDYKGFLSWAKDSWTGRNQGKDRTQAILESTGAANMNEAYSMYRESKAGLLRESILAIDEETLIKEFSGFLGPDMESYINDLRKMDRNQLYDEANKQANSYADIYGKF